MSDAVVIHYVSVKAGMEIGELEHLKDTMRNALRSEHRQIDNRLQQIEGELSDELMDSFGDDHYMLEQSRKLLGQFLVVGLYRIVEMGIKRMLLAKKCPSNAVDKASTIKGLKKILNQRLGIAINKKTPGFTDISKLREQNNAIKHGGKRAGKLPQDLLKEYEDHLPKVIPYLEMLGGQISKATLISKKERSRKKKHQLVPADNPRAKNYKKKDRFGRRRR